MDTEVKQRRSAVRIMGRLIGLIRPLLPVMCLAIILGIAGYLCAIFLTSLAGYELIRGLLTLLGATVVPSQAGHPRWHAAKEDVYPAGRTGSVQRFVTLWRAVLQPFYRFQAAGDHPS